MTSTVVSTLVGLFVGGLITFFVARYYYLRASEDLLEESRRLLAESKRLKDIVNLLAGGLINAGLFEGKFDPETGDLSRITISSSITLRWRTEAGEQTSEAKPEAGDEQRNQL
jgi:hypothetical protein